MQVGEIEKPGELEKLRPEWVALWQRTAAGPFQHPDWLLTWWRHLGNGELWTVTVRDRDRLVAVAPFCIYSDDTRRIRQLTLVGNGISDSCDILLDPDAPGAGQALAGRLLVRQHYWRSYDFRDLPANSFLVQLVRDRFGAPAIEDAPCVVLPLDHWRASPAGSGPARIVADLRRCRRRAEELGRVRIELAATSQLFEAFAGLFSLHSSRWRALGQHGVLDGTGLQDFHREVAERFAERRWLRLYRLFFGDTLAATNYGFCLRSRAYSYIGGFDPALARLSPGKMIIHRFISESVAEGAAEFNFLRGAEEYKFRWGGKCRWQYRLRSSSCIQEEQRHAH
jgi:CelD/BcsL family acetyltransferase involved in cellulose biosynthesis